MPSYLKRDNKPTLAYHFYEGGSDYPPLVFMGGFRSDMEGTKAIYLEEKCKARGQSFLRFDYLGHGESEGVFEECTISDWTNDAYDVMTHCFDDPAILMGSSMGGWVALLLGVNHPPLIHSLIGIAAAPDFTTWMEASMNEAQREELVQNGQFLLPNDYGEPYAITQILLDNGRTNILLDKEIPIQKPVRLIQGKRDDAVPWKTAECIKEKLTSEDVEITYLENGDHRLSSPEELEILNKAVEDLISS